MTWWQYVLCGIGGLIGTLMAFFVLTIAVEMIKEELQGRKGHNDK